jgi:hypothetical protein
MTYAATIVQMKTGPLGCFFLPALGGGVYSAFLRLRDSGTGLA